MPKNNLPKNQKEYQECYYKLKTQWTKKLKSKNVHLPRLNTAKSFWLVALYSNLGKPLGNTEIYNWMMTFDHFKSKQPPLKSDQQIRHLGMQDGWNLKRSGYEYLDEGISKILNGEYILSDVDNTFPAYAKSRRSLNNIKAKDFEDLKEKTGNICLTCWHKEGKKHPKTNKKISLQKGHMDPNKPLDINNTIPQCGYCNQTYKNKFVFGIDGRIKGINDIQFFYDMNKEKMKSDIRKNKIPKEIREVIADYEKNKKTTKTSS